MESENKQELGIEAQPAEVVEFTIKIEPPETYIYSNVAGVTLSPLDIRIHFADVAPTGESMRTKTVLGVVLPPEHAAGLVILLNQQLKNFESQFGEIRHPGWRAMMAAAKAKREQAESAGSKPKTDRDRT